MQGPSAQLEHKLKNAQGEEQFCQEVVSILAQEKPKALLTINLCDRLVHLLKREAHHSALSALLDLYLKAEFSFSLKLKLIGDLMNIAHDDKAIKTKAIKLIF